MTMACALGVATPTEESRSVWISARPQRRLIITRLIFNSDFLERWNLDAVYVGKNQVAQMPLPACMFSPLAFGTRLNILVEVQEEIRLALSWKGRIERFPEFLGRQLAWRPRYRNAWWVTRTRPPAMTIRAVAFGAVHGNGESKVDDSAGQGPQRTNGPTTKGH
jgi:hypothetical protein